MSTSWRERGSVRYQGLRAQLDGLKRESETGAGGPEVDVRGRR